MHPLQWPVHHDGAEPIFCHMLMLSINSLLMIYNYLGLWKKNSSNVKYDHLTIYSKLLWFQHCVPNALLTLAKQTDKETANKQRN